MDAEEFCLRWNNHHQVLVNVLDKLLEKESMCDVTLAADHQLLRVHRLVLCACSTYFEDMLSKQSDKQAFIFLKDVRFADLKALVDYMYKGEVNVAQDQLSSFLQTAEALDIKGLAYKDDGDQTGSKGKSNSQAPRFGVKRPSEASNSTASGQKPDNNQQTGPKPKLPPAKRPHVAAAPAESHNDQQDMVDDHFVAVEAKVESEDNEHTNPEDRLGDDNNGPDWASRDGEDDWSTSDPGLISILPNSSTTLKPNFDGGGPSSGTKSKTTNSTNNSATASTSNRGSFSMECPHCSKRYTHPNSYHRHVRNECIAVEPKFACPDCGSRFKRKAYLRDHHCKKSNATLSELSYCPACGRAYSFRSTMLRHYRYECSAVSGIPQFPCPYCPARFKRNERLSYHLENSHAVSKNQLYNLANLGTGGRLRRRSRQQQNKRGEEVVPLGSEG